MTHESVTGTELKELHDKFGEIVRRVVDGTIKFDATKSALQRVVEGEFKHSIPPTPSRPDVQMVTCQAEANHCSICHTFMDEGGVCQQGHQLGGSYSVVRY